MTSGAAEPSAPNSGPETPGSAPPTGGAPARPGISAWLRYTLGGTLPEHLEWVRHDLIDAGWRWRVVRRVLLVAMLFGVALALLPGPASTRVSLPLFLLVTSGFAATAAADALRDRRLRQHGLEPPPPPD